MADPKKSELHWTDRLQDFDRRWIFLAMAFAVLIPLLFPLNLPVKPSSMVKATYYTIDELKEGDRVFLSLDLDPASTPELEPFFKAVVVHLKRKKVKFVIASTWYSAPPLIERWIRETIESEIAGPDNKAYTGERDGVYKNNEDFIYLGFREGKEAVIASFGKNLIGTFDGVAFDGTPLDQIPMMDGIKQLSDFDLTVMISAGFPGIKEYVQQVQNRYKLRMVGACTAVSTTDLTPYYDSGQLLGLVGGMSASAEYEGLVGYIGTATAGTDVLNFGHMVVILAIMFGNFIYFSGRSRRRRGL